MRSAKLKTLDDLPLPGKRVLVRVDFNVTIGQDGRVDEYEDYRLEAAVPTIRELQQRRCKIILLTHLGRPRESGSESLEPIQQRLQELMGEDIRLTRKLFGSEVEAIVAGSEPGSIVILPNVRLDPREEQNSPTVAQELATVAEAYVNEAFSNSHRAHASMVALPALLPACAGRRTVLEVEHLETLRDHPQRPYLAIVSGAKVSTKEGLLAALLKRVDTLCVGGQLANVFLSAQGKLPTAHFDSADIAVAQKLIEQAKAKLLLPTDVVIGTSDGHQAVETVSVNSIPAHAPGVWDIGPATVREWLTLCGTAKTIMWNGPVGKQEVAPYDEGTKILARGLAGLAAIRVAGGGDTVNILERLKLVRNFDHVSVGGGAMLEFLEGKMLPGLEPLYA